MEMNGTCWTWGEFAILTGESTANGAEHLGVVPGWLCWPWGVANGYLVGQSPDVWYLTHLPSGMKVLPEGFNELAIMQTLAEAIIPLADWGADPAGIFSSMSLVTVQRFSTILSAARQFDRAVQ